MRLRRCPACRTRVIRLVDHLKRDCEVAGGLAVVGLLACLLVFWLGV